VGTSSSWKAVGPAWNTPAARVGVFIDRGARHAAGANLVPGVSCCDA